MASFSATPAHVLVFCIWAVSGQPQPTLFQQPSLISANTGAADVVFILDGSGSVTESRFHGEFMTFIRTLMSQLRLGPSGYQAAIIQFGNRGRIELSFNQTYRAEEIYRLGQNITFLNENTNTTGGLLETLFLFNTSHYGARARDPQVVRVGVLLTDGGCTWDCFRLSAVTQLVKQAGINMLSVGIGNRVNGYELATIASTADDVITLGSYQELTDGSAVRRVLTWLQNTVANNPYQANMVEGGEEGGDNSARDQLAADVVLLLDASESVGRDSYTYHVLPFAASLAGSLPISDTQYSFSVLTFGTSASMSLRLQAPFPDSLLQSHFATVPFRDDMTNTSAALRAVRHLVESSDWRDATRREVPVVAVMVTDGRPTVDAEMIIPEAQRLRSAGVQLFVLTVGADGDVDEAVMMAMASEPKSESHFRKHSFSELQQSATVEAVVNAIVARSASATVAQTTPGSTTGQESWHCDFEDDEGGDGWCGAVQATGDQFDWSRISGWTPSFDTGPYSAYSGNYYAFIEASNRQVNDAAVLMLPRLSPAGPYCVQFAYNMYGFHIRRLELVTRSYSGSDQVLWSKEGDQQSPWKTARVTGNLTEGQQLGFVGVRGEAHTGDIAIDDVTVTRGNC